MATHLWLDIEDTILTPVVEGWPNSQAIHQKKLKMLIDDVKPDTVNIFSFAVHSDFDRTAFLTFWAEYFKGLIGHEFSTIPTVDQIRIACCKQLMLSQDRVSFSDMCDFWSKQLAFELFIQDRASKKEAWGMTEHDHHILFDDAVIEKTFTLPACNVSGQTINVLTFFGDL